ncbi:MAG: TPM domain-containing protein [Nodosilinea sp.]
MSACLISGLIPIASPAITVDNLTRPNVGGGNWVVDDAGVLSARTERQLNRLLHQLNPDHGTVTVVTVEVLATERTAASVAADLLAARELDRTGQSNDVLLLLTAQPQQAEIAIGRGIIEQFTPDQATQIIETQILPPLAEGNFNRAAIAGTRSIAQALHDGWLPLWLLTRLEFWHPGYLFLLLLLGLLLDGYWALRTLAQHQIPAPKDQPVSPMTKTDSNHSASSIPRHSVTYWLGDKILLATASPTPVTLPPQGYRQNLWSNPTRLPICRLDQQDWIGLLVLTILMFLLLLGTGFLTAGVAVAVVVLGTGLFALAMYACLKWGIRRHFSHRENSTTIGMIATVVLWITVFLYACVMQNYDGRSPHAVVGNLSALGIIVYLLAVPIIASLIMADVLPLFVYARHQDDADEMRGVPHCRVCQQPMVNVKPDDQQLLNEAQQVALKLGSMEFDAWHCPHCYPQSPNTVMLLAMVKLMQNHQFAECSHCQERTMTVEAESPDGASQSHQMGRDRHTAKTVRKVFHFHCHCCGQNREEIHEIAAST